MSDQPQGRTHPPLAHQNIGRLRASFLLAQDPDDLLFCKPAWLHVIGLARLVRLRNSSCLQAALPTMIGILSQGPTD